MQELQKKIRQLVLERNWEQYHSPKNLAMGISIEANELMEIFMWLNEVESRALSEDQLRMVRAEVGDIMINLLNFCGKFQIDPIECASEKLEAIKNKYPVSKSFGSSKKYNNL